MTSRTLAQAGEAAVLSAIYRRLSAATGERVRGVRLGPGDDAAVLADLGARCVLSTDMLVEGKDFERDWATLRDVGAKAAAANLSDLAAMGAKPRGLLLAIAAQGGERTRDILGLVEATDGVGRAFGAPVVGGDLSSTDGPLVVSVTAVGSSADRPLRRCQARVGDLVFVSGDVGAAAAGLKGLQSGSKRGRCAVRQLRPMPQVMLGLALSKWGRVRSCCDVSDGLASDVAHLVPVGEKRGVQLQGAAIPIHPRTRALAKRFGVPPMDWALFGGEDFELVFSVAPSERVGVRRIARRLGVPLTEIGVVVRRPGVRVDRDLIRRRGFDHFS